MAQTTTITNLPMYFNVPDHKMNFFNVQIQGNFKDSKDSFYRLIVV